MNDALLIKNFLDGDESAFSTLVWKWHDPIYQFCYRFITNREDAHDLTQQTFIKAYNNLSSLNDSSKFASWIYQIALNQCKDEARKKHHQKIMLNFTVNHTSDLLPDKIVFEVSREVLSDYNDQKITLKKAMSLIKVFTY